MITKVELADGYRVTIENDQDKQKTILSIEDFRLMFVSKQEVIDHIKLLEKALEFWEYDSA